MCLLIPFYRPTGGKSNNAGVLPRWSDVCRNSCSPFPLSNGRQRDGVHYSHYKTHQWHNLDQIPHGQTWVTDALIHLHAQLATSNTHPSENLGRGFYVHISVLQVFYWCLCWLNSNRLFKGCHLEWLFPQQRCVKGSAYWPGPILWIFLASCSFNLWYHYPQCY